MSDALLPVMIAEFFRLAAQWQVRTAPHSFVLIRSEDFEHAGAELRAALFEFVDAAAVLAAAEIVGDADDEHDAADQGKEVGKGEGNIEILKDVGRYEVRG